MQLVETVNDLKKWRHGKSGRVGFVPTMGALHEGHMSLVRRARQECESVIVSIFVNPLQFGPLEDLNKYPRPLEKDLELCRSENVDLVFHPSVEQMYTPGGGETTKVVPPTALTSKLCGTFRPGHFTGIATVVLKLFNMVEPTVAYFGEKDYQQLMVIRKMVADLNVPVKIVGVPTHRAEDGLALSSRNVYLTEEQRFLAPELYNILCKVRDETLSKGVSLKYSLARYREIIRQLPGTELQYLEACDADTLAELEEARLPMVILVAAKLGKVRLIDNLIVRD
ncbi:MAG: pantoate--beta-alanine ligase [Candidatus Obscuribacterales bacterium]|nr:pantoate--beta-alanine ligase [Candidatus Obscuribacterales bacterium]